MPHMTTTDPSQASTPPLPAAIEAIQRRRQHNELHWLVSTIIAPEFPHILETLTACGNMLLYNSPQHPDTQQHIERGAAIKLAVSLTKLELLKGIIVRDGLYITQLVINLKESHFNRHLHRINLDQPVLLRQLLEAREAIDSAIVRIHNFNKDQNHLDLVRSIELILHDLAVAKESLQLPLDPRLVFPLNKTDPTLFRPELPPSLSLDFYISQAELCIDLKNLHRVTEEPWCRIDLLGKLYVDKVRDEMKTKLDGTISPHSLEVHSSESGGALKALGQLLKPKVDPQEYITKCFTYDRTVVMVNKKIEVLCPDPLLVSTYTKLDSLENVVGMFLHNLRVVAPGGP